MDLAMKFNLAHMMEDISTGVGDGDDPEVMKNSVEFLMQKKQYEKAVEIMISLNQFEEALTVSEQYGVNLKEEMAMKLLPPAS